MSEGTYAGACRIELKERGIPYESEKSFAVHYHGEFLGRHTVDLLIDRRLVLELKCVEQIHPVHLVQTTRYMRLARVRLGLLVNFNVPVLKQGIRRIVL